MRRSSRATVVGVAVLAVATSAVAVAAIPGSGGTVTACYTKQGAVRVIDPEAGDACSDREATLRFAAVDAAGRVADAQRLDGRDSSDFLAAGATAVDADKLDGRDSSDFLATGATAVDADKVDGRDSSEFLDRDSVYWISFTSTFEGEITVHGRSHEGITAQRLTAGVYEVSFPSSAHPLTSCAAVGSGQAPSASRVVTVSPGEGTVMVRRASLADQGIDGPLHLAAHC